jgi:hypothetical protein
MCSENNITAKRKIYLVSDYSRVNLDISTGGDGPNPRQNSNINTVNLIWLLSRKLKQGPDGDISFYALKYIELPNNKVSGSNPDEVDFSIYLSFQPHYGPGVDSASNRNEYQEYFWG